MCYNLNRYVKLTKLTKYYRIFSNNWVINMDLGNKKRELVKLINELANLKKDFQENDSSSLRSSIYLTTGKINKLIGEIAILEKIEELERKHRNREPINFYHGGGASVQNVAFSSDNVNYEKAYEQQKKLLGLELTHYKALPISGIEYGEPDYEKLYNQNRDALLDMSIDYDVNDVEKEPAHLKTDVDIKDSIDSPTGKHFKKIDLDNEKNHTFDNSYVGAKHFKPNLLSLPYAVFIKDGVGYIVGNFTSDYLNSNYELLDSKLLDENLKGVKLINSLDYGVNNVQGLDVKINVEKYGNIDIIGDVDALEYHNQISDEKDEDSLDDENQKVVISSDDELSKEPINEEVSLEKDSIQDGEDMAGLDVIPDMPDLQDLSHGAENVEPVIKGRIIKRKKASLIEKFKNLKTWQKAVIIGGAIAVIGIGAFVLGPHIMEAINNLVNPEHMNTANNMINTVNDTMSNATSSVSGLDYGSIGEGHTVFTNAYDAASNAHGVISNEWFSNNPLDVFNTATNSYMGLSPEQLNDPTFMAELAKDPNNALLFGDSMASPSGFVGLDDIISEITKGGMMR